MLCVSSVIFADALVTNAGAIANAIATAIAAHFHSPHIGCYLVPTKADEQKNQAPVIMYYQVHTSPGF